MVSAPASKRLVVPMLSASINYTPSVPQFANVYQPVFTAVQGMAIALPARCESRQQAILTNRQLHRQSENTAQPLWFLSGHAI